MVAKVDNMPPQSTAAEVFKPKAIEALQFILEAKKRLVMDNASLLQRYVLDNASLLYRLRFAHIATV